MRKNMAAYGVNLPILHKNCPFSQSTANNNVKLYVAPYDTNPELGFDKIYLKVKKAKKNQDEDKKAMRTIREAQITQRCVR
jgi:hypothetical protein